MWYIHSLYGLKCRDTKSAALHHSYWPWAVQFGQLGKTCNQSGREGPSRTACLTAPGSHINWSAVPPDHLWCSKYTWNWPQTAQVGAVGVTTAPTHPTQPAVQFNLCTTAVPVFILMAQSCSTIEQTNRAGEATTQMPYTLLPIDDIIPWLAVQSDRRKALISTDLQQRNAYRHARSASPGTRHWATTPPPPTGGERHAAAASSCQQMY